jgi:FkbM family methyltransferase
LPAPDRFPGGLYLPVWRHVGVWPPGTAIRTGKLAGNPVDTVAVRVRADILGEGMNRELFDDTPFGSRKPGFWLGPLIALTRLCGPSWAGKRLAFVLRRLGIMSLGGPVDIRTLGVNMRLYPFHNVCEKRLLFTPQYFDAEERAVLAGRIHDAFVFIDIGANVGGYALFVAGLAGPRARALAVEPQPEIHRRLLYNIRQNPSANVTAVACAVADRDGEIEFFLSADNQGQASVKDTEAQADGVGRLTVPALTLTSLLRQQGLERVDAIKIDVEGAEDLVLEPFFRDAPESLWPGLIVIENSPSRWRVDLFGHMESLGYRRLAATRLNRIYERRIQE